MFRLVKRGPATTGIEFGGRVKQGGAAADAKVLPSGPLLFIATAVGSFRGRMASDVKGNGFSPLGGQNLFPFEIGFFNFHDEQDTAIDWAQWGG